MKKTINIGLVCEGKTDFEILTRTLIASITSAGYLCTYKYLQPSRDATSGSYGEGGWRQVYQWCVRNDPQSRVRYFGKNSLFEGVENDAFDLILVQIDGDICAEIKGKDLYDDLGIESPEQMGIDIESDVELRRKYIKAIVDEWLKNTSKYSDDDHCLPVPIIMAAESWIIGSCSDLEGIENISNPKSAVSKLWFTLKDREAPKKINKMKKPLEKYIWIFDNSNVNLDLLKRNCTCYKKSVKEILQTLS